MSSTGPRCHRAIVDGSIALRGFTLIEVILAVALLGIVLSTTYAAIVQARFGVESARTAVAKGNLGHQTVALAAELLGSVYYRPDRPDLAFSAQTSNLGRSILGRIEFASVAGHLSPFTAHAGEVLRCELALQINTSGQKLLTLSMVPLLSAADRNERQTFVLSDQVGGLRLGFLTPLGWVEQFDPGQWEGLPSMVRVSVYDNHSALIGRRLVPIRLAQTYPAQRRDQ